MSSKVEQDQKISDDGYMQFLRLNGSMIKSVENVRKKVFVDSVADTGPETGIQERVNSIDPYD